MMRRLLFVLVFGSAGLTTCEAQSPVAFSYESYGLENDTLNLIQNASHLDHFFQALYELKNHQRRRVSIVHIGDSHVQGDYLTQPIRQNIQLEFGNAGRGLIVPGRVAGTNESFNIRTSSDISWQAKRCVYPDEPLPIGVGGITIQTDETGELTIAMTDSRMDYSFRDIRLFYLDDSLSFDFVVRDSLSEQVGVITPHADQIHSELVRLTEPVSRVQLQVIKQREAQARATIFGISLENEKEGVLYHSVGVNGAKYKHYNAAEFFAQQVSALEPELFVISLGTNEALDYPYVDRSLGDQINKLLMSLQQYNPQALFILSTPPPGFRRRKLHNPGLDIVREQVIQYAAENGYAFWDLYKILGGEAGAQRWKAFAFLRPDGVHFTKEGYAYQGNLFYHALMKGYNEYVLRLRP